MRNYNTIDRLARKIVGIMVNNIHMHLLKVIIKETFLYAISDLFMKPVGIVIILEGGH